MRLYEVPITITLTFEEAGPRDLNARMGQIRTALLKIARYVLDRFEVNIEYEIGKPEVLAERFVESWDDGV